MNGKHKSKFFFPELQIMFTVNNVESDKGNGLGFSLSKSLIIRSIILGSFCDFVVSLPIPRSDFVLHNEKSVCVGSTSNNYNSKRT